MRAGARDETIVALATPPGIGAIAVIRVSGPAALTTAGRVFRGRQRLEEAHGYSLHHGFAVDAAEEHVDEVVAAVFRAPHSYTGEDLVEVSCHGGPGIAARLVELVVEAGARHADPGEFTRRAFLNGRIDLSQAEAVMGLISAQGRAAARASLAQLEGRLGERVGVLRRSLLELCALLELELDFAEEGLPLLDRQALPAQLAEVAHQVASLAATYSQGRVLREGVGVVLAGKPNAGKSSLFNALLKEARAIVTPQAGTTRDLLEESLVLDGVSFRLHDTAGLREAREAAEAEGIRRSHAALAGADIVLAVVDPEDSPSAAEAAALRSLSAGGRIIWALNKSDLWSSPPVAPWAGPGEAVVSVSALAGSGLKDLEQELVGSVQRGEITSSGVLITSQRQFQALEGAGEALERALKSVKDGYSNEFAALDVHVAADRLAEITGEITSEEILNAIFSQFCIGK